VIPLVSDEVAARTRSGVFARLRSKPQTAVLSFSDRLHHCADSFDTVALAFGDCGGDSVALESL
jgi:hypothetical protein